MNESVHLNNVTKVYQGGMIGALTGVSLTVTEGEFVVIMGPSAHS